MRYSTNKVLAICFFAVCLFTNVTSTAQQKTPGIAELLGYPADARLLIIHADDLGVAHSKNSASISAWEQHGINSASIMVPTPWFPEIAAYARKNPEFDLGLHLTLTAEWQFYKWNGVLASNEIPTLVNEQDYFYASVSDVVEHADPAEVEKELRAQIERAIDFGIKPTHLDTHMGTLHADPDFFEIYLRLGEEYKIPVYLPIQRFRDRPPSGERERFLKLANEYPVHLKEVVSLNSSTPESNWFDAYDQMIRELEPGLNEMVIHPAYDNAEMQAMTINAYHSYEAAWRQRDYDYVVSRRFKDLLEEEEIILVTWRDVQELLYPESG